MIKPDVKKAAPDSQKQEGYCFDLTREADAFYADYPDRRNHVYLMQLQNNLPQLVRGKLGDEHLVTPYLQRHMGVMEVLDRFIASSFQGLAVNFQYSKEQLMLLRLDDVAVTAAAALPLQAGQNILKKSWDVKMHWTLHHEIGHLVLPEGLAHKNKSECLADARAALKHIQCFGRDTGAVQSRSRYLATSLFFNKRDAGEHFTSPVLSRIFEDSLKQDFRNLKSERLDELAVAYANHHALDAAVVDKLAGAFHSDKNTALGKIEDFADFVFSADMAPHYKWSSTALRCLLGDQCRLTGQTEAVPHDTKWNRVRQKLQACDLRL